MSKKSIIRKRLAQSANQPKESVAPGTGKKPALVKPVASNLRRKRKLNLRFIILLAVWIIGLIIAIYFLTSR